MKRLTFCVSLFALVLGCSAFASAYQDTYTFTFDLSDLAFTQERGFDKVILKGAMCAGEPGYPWLPMKTIQIAIPEWQEVEEVEVISAKRLELPKKYQVYPMQPMVEISRVAQRIDFTAPNPEAYALTTEYPGKLAEMTNNGFLAGQHIAGVALYPLQYIPSEDKLILYTEIELRLVFKPTTRYPVPVMQRSEKTAQFYSDMASKMVINPEDVQYQVKGFPKSGSQVDFLIIVPDTTYEPVLDDLADWKIRKGISTEIVTKSDLTSSYSGDDDEEKIRAGIKDYYSTKGTGWVLIVGDADLVPIRYAYIWTAITGIRQYIPCQLYYSDLDGDWNADDNDWIGEYDDEVDLYPDVYLGRAPASDTSEARVFVEKCLYYETSLQCDSSDDYLERVLFFAAHLGWADGRDIKDTIKAFILPSGLDLTELYQTDETLTRSSLCDAFNQGQNIINHDGHGRWNGLNICYADTIQPNEGWYNDDMDTLKNDNMYGLLYTPGCNTAALDSSSDCIGEHWVNNADKCGIAYCGNTRSGYSVAGSALAGPSPELDTSFFSMIFNEDIYPIGASLAESKVAYVPLAQVPYWNGIYYRYCVYSLLLLGDPTLELWTDTLDQLTVSHDLAVPSGAKSFVVDVQEDDALVNCVNLISGELAIMGTAYSSGGSALVLFDSPAQLGNVIVTVTKHNYELYSDTLPILGFVPPEVVYYSHTADDSVGTDNGLVNPGDSATVLVTLKNLGGTKADSVTAILTTADTFIDLDTAEVYFGDINGGSTAQGQSPWVFKVDPDCPDSHVVVFKLDAKDKNDSTWTSGLELMVLRTDFTLAVDTSDSDTKGVTVGDSVDFTLDLDTTGGFIWQVKLVKPRRSPFGLVITINPDTLTPPGQSTLRVKTTALLNPDIYYITVTGASAAGGDSIYHDLTVTVFVEPSASPMLDTWYVSTAGDNSLGNGTEDLPFRTIQKGIDTASDGDTVMVEKGVYDENIDFDGKDILVTSRYWPDSTEAAIESTIIDGRFKGPVVRFNSGEGNSAHLMGFTILNGFYCTGAGIYIDSSSSPIIERNLITLNSTETVSGYGRGGPAIHCGTGSKSKLIRNLIYDNWGPAVVSIYKADSVEIINNTIARNVGGGICAQAPSACTTWVRIKNTIVSENLDYGIFASASGSGEMNTEITFNDVWANINVNGDTIQYAGDLDDLTDTLGNISHDPLFDSVEIGDYHLSCYSPCIDSGDTADSVPPNGGSRIDMGAFEFEYTSTDTICGDLDYDGCVTWRDHHFLKDWLYNNGPAPVPQCLADVNGDGYEDIGDLVYLQNYLEGGDPPVDDCCD